MYEVKLSKKEFDVYGNENFKEYWYHNDGAFKIWDTDSTVFKTVNMHEAQRIIEVQKETAIKNFDYLEQIGQLGVFTSEDIFGSWNRCNVFTIEKVKEKK